MEVKKEGSKNQKYRNNRRSHRTWSTRWNWTEKWNHPHSCGVLVCTSSSVLQGHDPATSSLLPATGRWFIGELQRSGEPHMEAHRWDATGQEAKWPPNTRLNLICARCRRPNCSFMLGMSATTIECSILTTNKTQNQNAFHNCVERKETALRPWVMNRMLWTELTL